MTDTMVTDSEEKHLKTSREIGTNQSVFPPSTTLFTKFGKSVIGRFVGICGILIQKNYPNAYENRNGRIPTTQLCKPYALKTIYSVARFP